MEALKVVLDNVNKDIKDGKYDDHLTIPFMSRELIRKSLIGRIESKVEKGGNPLLTDAEVKGCISDAKEAAATAFHLYKKFGFLEQKEDGSWEITKKGKLAIKHAQSM